MKALLIFLSFVAAVLAVGNDHTRGCLYILGRCHVECEEGTHSYNSGCASPTWSEKTCASPTAHDMGAICDLSRCECDEPTVKDESTGKCVLLKDCPKQE